MRSRNAICGVKFGPIALIVLQAKSLRSLGASKLKIWLYRAIASFQALTGDLNSRSQCICTHFLVYQYTSIPDLSVFVPILGYTKRPLYFTNLIRILKCIAFTWIWQVWCVNYLVWTLGYLYSKVLLPWQTQWLLQDFFFFFCKNHSQKLSSIPDFFSDQGNWTKKFPPSKKKFLLGLTRHFFWDAETETLVRIREDLKKHMTIIREDLKKYMARIKSKLQLQKCLVFWLFWPPWIFSYFRAKFTGYLQ
jgi:hypothetical protein